MRGRRGGSQAAWVTPCTPYSLFRSFRSSVWNDGSQATCVPNRADSSLISIFEKNYHPVLIFASGVAGRPSPPAPLILFISLLIDFSESRSCG